MHLAEYNHFDSPINIVFDSFITNKTESDLQLVLKLCSEGLITIPGSLFKISQKQEINSFIARKIF
jgi:hypothetical protein